MLFNLLLSRKPSVTSTSNIYYQFSALCLSVIGWLLRRDVFRVASANNPPTPERSRLLIFASAVTLIFCSLKYFFASVKRFSITRFAFRAATGNVYYGACFIKALTSISKTYNRIVELKYYIYPLYVFKHSSSTVISRKRTFVRAYIRMLANIISQYNLLLYGAQYRAVPRILKLIITVN
jgi:hypothetical protein